MSFRKVCIIIPSRMNSTRFPNKPLIDIDGVSMIQRVYKKCLESKADAVVVATSDQIIYDHVSEFGVCIMTPEFDNGTLRVCHAVKQLSDKYDYIINVQGDQPYLDVNFLNRFIDDLFWLRGKIVLTGASKLQNHQDLIDPNSVKLIGNEYIVGGFTRSPFFIKNKNLYKHIGVYGFRYRDIEEIESLKPSDLSKRESLEQVRWMEEGFKMLFTLSYTEAISIDTPEDLENCIVKIKKGEIK